MKGYLRSVLIFIMIFAIAFGGCLYSAEAYYEDVGAVYVPYIDQINVDYTNSPCVMYSFTVPQGVRVSYVKFDVWVFNNGGILEIWINSNSVKSINVSSNRSYTLTYGSIVYPGSTIKLVGKNASSNDMKVTVHDTSCMIIQFDMASQASVDAAKSSADTAATNAQNAYNAANAAKTSADAAKTSADTAAARVWDSTESKSAATLAKEARDKANQALTEINNVKTVVNNLRSSVTPQIQKISGLNGATCTKTTSFTVVVQASGATQYRVKLDNGSWGSWTAMGTPTTVTVSTTGAHTVYVEIQNASGATASGQMTFFKI